MDGAVAGRRLGRLRRGRRQAGGLRRGPRRLTRTQNLDPLLHVLRAVGRGRARGLTFLSSGGAVYGPEAPVPTPEDAPLWPASSYGVIKATAEQYVALHARR